jgi:ubiquinone/menaquinone biosynthesis C-methylase UbiE
VKKSNVCDSDNEKKLHYENVKEYFKKSAADKFGFYDFKSEEKLERELKKRSMWKIYTSILNEILKGDSYISNVIDVACGMGNFTRELSKYDEFKKIVGIDFLKETFEIARNTNNKFVDISFIQADLLNLPFTDQSFDFTICLNTLHHIYKNDLNKAINELSRITKHYIMIEIRNKNCIFKPLINQIVLQKVYRDLPINCSSISDLNFLMKNNGFVPKIIRGNSTMFRTSWRLVLVYKRN